MSGGFSSCQPWDAVSEDECKLKCLKNEVKPDKCTDKKCAFVIYDTNKQRCHFADDEAKSTTGKDRSDVKFWRKGNS